MNGWSTGEFVSSETILCDTVVVDPCHRMFVKTHRMFNTQPEP